MTGNDVVRHIRQNRPQNATCIKWWRSRQSMVDFELIDHFVERVRPDEEFDDFRLLDLEEMWHLLTELDPDRLERVKKGAREEIEWRWTDNEGGEKVTVYPFTPEALLTLLDDELFA